MIFLTSFLFLFSSISLAEDSNKLNILIKSVKSSPIYSEEYKKLDKILYNNSPEENAKFVTSGVDHPYGILRSDFCSYLQNPKNEGLIPPNTDLSVGNMCNFRNGDQEVLDKFAKYLAKLEKRTLDNAARKESEDILRLHKTLDEVCPSEMNDVYSQKYFNKCEQKITCTGEDAVKAKAVLNSYLEEIRKNFSVSRNLSEAERTFNGVEIPTRFFQASSGIDSRNRSITNSPISTDFSNILENEELNKKLSDFFDSEEKIISKESKGLSALLDPESDLGGIDLIDVQSLVESKETIDNKINYLSGLNNITQENLKSSSFQESFEAESGLLLSEHNSEDTEEFQTSVSNYLANLQLGKKQIERTQTRLENFYETHKSLVENPIVEKASGVHFYAGVPKNKMGVMALQTGTCLSNEKTVGGNRASSKDYCEFIFSNHGELSFENVPNEDILNSKSIVSLEGKIRKVKIQNTCNQNLPLAAHHNGSHRMEAEVNNAELNEKDENISDQVNKGDIGSTAVRE